MRIFTESERALLQKLATWRDGRPYTMEEFLVANVFVEGSEQALIIQPQKRCAVLYHTANLEPDKHGIAERRFFEMVALLSYLRSSGLIVVFEGQYRAGALYYLHASFDAPRVEGQTIKLNARGDHTNHPDTILDKNQQVLFKGTLLEGESYELVLRSLTGTVCVSQALLALLATRDEPRPDAQPKAPAPPTPAPVPKPTARKRTWRAPLAGVAAIALGASLSYLCLRARSTSAAVAAVASSLETLSQKQDDRRETTSQAPAAAREGSVRPSGDEGVASKAPATQPRSEPSEAAREAVRANVPAHVVAKIQSATATPSSSPPLYGVDISHWNGDFALEIDRIPGLSFAISKATEGTKLRDSQFPRNRELLRKRKIAHGSYHFFRQAEDAVAQGEFFLATVGAIAQDDIAPVVDVEDESLPRGVETEVVHVQVSVLLLLRTLFTKTGRRPILYTNYAFAQRYFHNPSFADYRLWLAEYTSASPRVPDAWREVGFFIWQKSGSHKLGREQIDLDVFFGSKPELLR